MQQNSSEPGTTRWERAYLTFESPEQELRKFRRRLLCIGADRWDRRLRIVEICSGRGSGLRAWHALGYGDIIGVDCSAALVRSYAGPGRSVLGDARCLPLESGSRDVAVVQGGLHHLLNLRDVRCALAEMRRVVSADGRIVIVEPWLTPFLKVVHSICARPSARRVSTKIDAFATMFDEERDTYERWLNAPDECLDLIRQFVVPHLVRRQWGKLIVVGAPRK